MSFLRRQLVTAALTANAIRPIPGFRAGIPAFAAGWLTSELAPHLFALTAADTAVHLTPKRRSRAGLLLAAANLAGQAFLLDQARRVQKDAEDALVEGLGYDYIEQLDAKPTPAELATPWRRLVNPFRMRSLDVIVEKDIAYAPEHGKRGLLDIYRPASGDRRERPRAAPGARRRLDDRQQGPAGHPADAAPRRQGLGLRRDQLPARAARPVPRPDHRREAGHRLGAREHRGVRRRPGLHRDHRRVRRRPPRRARGGDRRTTRRTSPASRTPTPASRSPYPTTASTTSPARPGCAAPS